MRLAVTGERRWPEFARLAEKLGFTPLLRSTMRTEALPVPSFKEDLERLAKEGTEVFIALTGVGVKDLWARAEELGLDLKPGLEKALRLARGPKAARALKELGLPPHGVGDGTSQSLLALLPPGPLGRVTLQRYGKPVPLLEEALQGRGTLLPLMPYAYLPASLEEIHRLEEEIENRLLLGVAFTAAVQVEYLFEEAKDPKTLKEAFREVFALAIGRVTAEALRAYGVERIFLPRSERLGALLWEFKAYLEEAWVTSP